MRRSKKRGSSSDRDARRRELTAIYNSKTEAERLAIDDGAKMKALREIAGRSCADEGVRATELARLTNKHRDWILKPPARGAEAAPSPPSSRVIAKASHRKAQRGGDWGKDASIAAQDERE